MNKKQLIAFEAKVTKLWESGKIRVPVHLSGGNEDELIRIFRDIKRSDYVFSTHRNHNHYLLHTGDTQGLYREILNLPGSICKGASGSMHTCNHKSKFYSSGIVAGCVAIACGVAKALQRDKSNRKVWCFIGDGCVDEGWFWEALRYAHGHELPITYIIEDNDRSVCTPKATRWGKKDKMYQALSQFYPHVRSYFYTPKWPHVGTNHQIQW